MRTFKKNKIALCSFIILLLIVIIVVVGPFICSFSYSATDVNIKNMPPSRDHWFGTDTLGRDLFARVCKGGQVSLIIGVLGTIIELFIGVICGSVAGYFGGIIDLIMMRFVEVLLSIPYLLVVILISLFIGKGIISLIIAMTITGWCTIARLIRGQIFKLKEQEYVLAAKALGASHFRIIFKHLLPNIMGILIVNITLDIPAFIFSEAFLSYIGLGIQSPQTSWGSLTSSAQGNLMFYPYQMFFPALFISLTMLSFNLLGDGLRDALDPKLDYSC